MTDKKLDIVFGGVPRYYAGNDIGVVLVHGLTGAPVTLYWMAEYLNQKGFTTYCPRLSGHGTSPEYLYHISWHEWYFDVLAAYKMLKLNCSQVFIVGFSLGGVLTLTLGANEDPDGLIIMSSPNDIKNPYIPFIPLVTPIKKTWRKAHSGSDADKANRKMLDELKRERGEPSVNEEGWYEDWILPAIYQTDKMLTEMRKGLSDITAPVLFMHSEKDEVVSLEESRKNFNAVSSTDKELFILEKSLHVISRSFEMETVWEKAYDFIIQHC